VIIKDYKFLPVREEGAEDTEKAVLIGEEEGARNFIMRVFRIIPGGFTPYHKHDWEHEVYILRGEGTVKIAGKEEPIKQRDAAFIPPNIEHQFINTGNEILEFICVIPTRKR